jgi:hypothetical protein
LAIHVIEETQQPLIRYRTAEFRDNTLSGCSYSVAMLPICRFDDNLDPHLFPASEHTLR